MSSTNSFDISEDFHEPKVKDASNPDLDYFISDDVFYTSVSHPTVVSKEHSNEQLSCET